MTDPFEQQLQQLHPVPVNGLEEMLYQAGWQAGRTAALTEQASSVLTGAINGQVSRQWTRLGFIGGAASGLVAASLMFAIAAWSGWLPNANPPGSNPPSEQLASAPEAPAVKGEPAPAEQPDSATLATKQQGRGAVGFNLLSWFDSGAEAFTRALPQTRSQMLTTAPVNSGELNRLLSVSANFTARELPVLDDSEGRERIAPEFLRYRPGENSLPGGRF
jgi:hypothetical protein